MRSGPPVDTLGSHLPGGRRWRPARVLGPLALVLLAYLVWPYVTLWRLDRALLRDDQAALAELVDLAAVQNAIRRQLDKNADSTTVPVSDGFVTWLEEAIRQHGTAALDQAVTLAWVRERLLAQSPPGAGLEPVLADAMFDDPLHFSVRLGGASQAPVRVRLGLTGLGWRVRALYY